MDVKAARAINHSAVFRITRTVLCAALVALPGAVSALPHVPQSNSSSAEKRIIPTLVNVNRHGKVVEISPGVRLTPQYRQLLKSTISSMIKKPATEHGHAVSSQFIMNLALKSAPAGDGKYSVHFVYVSSKPLPGFGWYWIHTANHKLRLGNRENDFTPRMGPGPEHGPVMGPRPGQGGGGRPYTGGGGG